MSDITVTNLGNGRYRVSSGTSHRLGWAAGPATARWVFFDGRVYVLDRAESPDAASRATHDDMALASPMPATVVAVNVTPGQQVARGDILIMLEAMKMELPVSAPRGGRIRSIACRPGDLVQPGVPLLDLE